MAATDDEGVAVVPGQLFDCLPDGAKAIADRLCQRHAGPGDGDTIALAREQFDRQLLFEIGDMAADRRLRDVELLGRGGQAAMPCGGLEDDHGVQKRKRRLESLHDPGLTLSPCLFDMKVYHFCICRKPFRIANSIETSS